MKSSFFIVIDFFCGFGGTTHGYTKAKLFEMAVALVIACVNHDWKAIKSHWRNHRQVQHFNEDITKLYGQVIGGFLFKSPEFLRLIRLVDLYRAFYPDAKIVLWASLECTNFSNAKGGLPRDADSRTLADHLDRYIRVLEPDYVKIENVVEFMSWGPMKSKIIKDKDGFESCPMQWKKVKIKKEKKFVLRQFRQMYPESKKNGQDWMRWRKNICSLGYRDEWKELNSANYGAYTSRNRLFEIFAKDGLPIVWPEPTHEKDTEKEIPIPNPNKPSRKRKAKAPELFESHELLKWRPVKEVLDFKDEGESIFTRKKPLVDATLERIYAGLVKFVAKGDTSFLSKYYTGNPTGMNASTAGPAGTITTSDHHSLIQPKFLLKYNSRRKDGSYVPPSIEEPSPVITTQNRLGLVQPEFLMHYYSRGGETSSIDAPCPTVTAMDGKALIQPEYFIERQFGKGGTRSIDNPAAAVMPNDKHRLVTAETLLAFPQEATNSKPTHPQSDNLSGTPPHHFLINPSWGGNPGSIERPCCLIVARQDKAPLYFVRVEQGTVNIAVFEDDSPVMIRIKQFMAVYGLVDIKMRMLRVRELLKIQGFPEDYKMVGSQADQKKFIGNSVVPHVVKAWAEALAGKILERDPMMTLKAA
jgi:DNA (cytosine-5)-methyltransferase 1